MKKLIVFSSIALLGALISCDKVTNAYPKTGGSSELDWGLYPDGDSAYYVSQGLWPTFTANTNTLRNVMIEDFTGHRCNNCPNAATLLHNLEIANPGRVFGASVHTSPTGVSTFQATNTEFTSVFYNDDASAIGSFFGSQAGTSFLGNPHGTVNRMLVGTDNTSSPGQWTSKTTTLLASTLQVNIQSKANYFPTTRGVFVHTEVEKIDNSLTDDIAIVVSLLEDTLVAPQIMPNTTTNSTYVHRDIFRGNIDQLTWGTTLNSTYLNSNGKYYKNYSFALPSTYDPTNMHLLIYVYNKTTLEILQVIHQDIIE